MTVPEFRVGVSSVADSAMVQFDSTTRGVLVPRMTTAQRTAISSPATALLVYDTDLSALYIYIGGWVAVAGSAGGAPANATYITQTASSGLSAEQALSSLATGLMQVTTATGVVSSVTTSAGLAALISDETGTGALVFAGSPVLTGNVSITGDANTVPLLILTNNDSSGSTIGSFRFQTSRNSTAVQANDRIGTVNARGYGATGFGSTEDGSFDFRAIENFTDTAKGTYLELFTTLIGTVGTTQRMKIGVSKVLTNNSAISVLSLTNAAAATIGGMLHYCIEVTDGTDMQVESGSAYWTGYHKGAAFAQTITEVASQQDRSSGTLATTWAISGANPSLISINANSSLTPSAGYPRITFTAQNYTQQSVAIV